MNNLRRHNIFALPLDDFSSRHDVRLLYAPLAGVCSLASTDEIECLDKDVDTYPDCPSAHALEPFMQGSPEQAKANAVATADDFLQLYILPSFKCNFACSYCFSAMGRATEEIKPEQLLAVIDFFVDRRRIDSDFLSISYLGGGEPTLSWDIVRQGIERADELAKTQGIKIFHTIVTNGSRLTPDMVDFLRDHDVLTRVSFEILPDIQALQRGQYERVAEGLSLAGERGARHMVRSMITPDNVERLEEMILTLHREFPAVKSVLFDPITSSDTFHDVDVTTRFYDNYIRHFLAARELGKTLGIDVGCATLRNLDLIVDRYCAGEFCLTPDGALTICHQVSSPREKDFDDFVYGRVGVDGSLDIDREKFLRLKSRYTVYDNPRCNHCDVRWTCGGGCTQQRRQYTDDILDITCRAERRLTTAFLLERLADEADIARMIASYDAE